jgi:hypothetical protein
VLRFSSRPPASFRSMRCCIPTYGITPEGIRPPRRPASIPRDPDGCQNHAEDAEARPCAVASSNFNSGQCRHSRAVSTGVAKPVEAVAQSSNQGSRKDNQVPCAVHRQETRLAASAHVSGVEDGCEAAGRIECSCERRTIEPNRRPVLLPPAPGLRSTRVPARCRRRRAGTCVDHGDVSTLRPEKS